MTGMGMAAASGRTPTPFTATIVLSGGKTYNVAGASGDLYTSNLSVISINESGGVPPYSDSHSVTLDSGPGGVSIVAASDGIHDTIAWTGLASVGNSIICHMSISANDSAGASSGSTYSPITITRTS